jgi:hypothetical protein
MSKKSITSFNLDQAISRISRPSIFDRIVKEVDAKEIPAKYIESILVQYHDGNVVELHGNEITWPIPLNRDISQEDMENAFKKMREVRIFIATDRLEIDINIMVEELLGKYC